VVGDKGEISTEKITICGMYIQNLRELVRCPELLNHTDRDIANVETASNPIREANKKPKGVVFASFGYST